MKKASDILKDLPDGSEFVKGIYEGKTFSIEDEIKMTLLIIWLQSKGIHLTEHRSGEIVRACLNISELIHQFCTEDDEEEELSCCCSAPIIAEDICSQCREHCL